MALSELMGREEIRWVNGAHTDFQPQAEYKILHWAFHPLQFHVPE